MLNGNYKIRIRNADEFQRACKKLESDGYSCPLRLCGYYGMLIRNNGVVTLVDKDTFYSSGDFSLIGIVGIGELISKPVLKPLSGKEALEMILAGKGVEVYLEGEWYCVIDRNLNIRNFLGGCMIFRLKKPKPVSVKVNGVVYTSKEEAHKFIDEVFA